VVNPAPAVFVLALAATAAHPLHTTLATVEWHGDRRELDVAVRVFTQDLAGALSRGAVSDSAACRYARQVLPIRDRAGASLPVARCSTERAADITWIRWSVAARSAAGLSIRDAFLFECFPDQVNIVQVDVAGANRTILFTSGDGPKALT
jgi:hypothetical protein